VSANREKGVPGGDSRIGFVVVAGGWRCEILVRNFFEQKIKLNSKVGWFLVWMYFFVNRERNI